MQIRSTVTSVSQGEFSLLAAVETFAAMLATALVAGYFDTYIHIAISVAIAPLLLLRTENSTVQVITIFDSLIDSLLDNRFIKKIDKSSTLVKIFLFALVVLIFPLLGLGLLIIKISVTAYNLMSAPLKTLTQIPRNWYRVAFTMDCMHPPELVPGLEALENTAPEKTSTDYRFSRLLPFDLKDPSDAVISFLTVVFLFLPTFLYRYSLKSTSIIYLPFIWFVNYESNNNATNIKLDYYAGSQLEKLKRVYAWFV